MERSPTKTTRNPTCSSNGMESGRSCFCTTPRLRRNSSRKAQKILESAVSGDCMSESDDKKLGMDRPITRRDFLNGVAVGTGGTIASSALPSFALGALADPGAAQDQPGYYPP